MNNQLKLTLKICGLVFSSIITLVAFWQEKEQAKLADDIQRVEKFQAQFHPQSNTNLHQPTTSNVPPPQTENLAENSRKFFNKIEFIIANVGTRERKLSSLMSLLKEAKTEDEMITTLQALENFKPIEHADDLILFLNNPNLSAKVKNNVINTLAQSILLDDEIVERIGASTVDVQSEKVRNYINGIVENPNSPKDLYNPAVQNYYYTSDNMVPFAQKLFNSDKPLNEAETKFLASALFTDKESTEQLLPMLVQNKNALTDDLVSTMGTYSTQPVVLEQLSDQDKQHLIDIFQSYQFKPDNPLYDIETSSLLNDINELKQSLNQ